jgi:hypothetical protein
VACGEEHGGPGVEFGMWTERIMSDGEGPVGGVELAGAIAALRDHLARAIADAPRTGVRFRPVESTVLRTLIRSVHDDPEYGDIKPTLAQVL